MKVFANDKAYVQKIDLTYFLRGTEGMSVPSSIFDKLFSDLYVVSDNDNRYEFIEFSQPKEIEFFKNCDWMVDYNQFDDMTEEQIMEYAYKIHEERNKTANEYNSLSEEEKDKQYMQTSTKIELLEFKMWSVRDILWHKQGYLKFPLPEGTKTNFITSNATSEKTKKEPILQKVLKRIKKL